ncbi:hypothetical protein LBMAG23_12220 [Bacteroidota bacterium]|nr:hypothetical protein LBMAG23_12220 [Bacteroidota bacterium]
MAKLFTNLFRVIVGVLFIFSGLIKANDPSGLSYKMQEFFEVWNLTGLNDATLIFSILMIAFEIIAGVAVLLGWQFNLFSWLLFMLIVFFTFLTGYAVFSGAIRECGCFGDCIKLTADQSFIKDIILFGMIGFLLMKRNSVRPLFNNYISALILSLSTILSFLIQIHVLQHQPYIDCLPYKVGKDIQEGMKAPPGSIPDSTVIKFVYVKDGKEVEFDTEHFPADFNDSAYVFVKRYDQLIREGNAKPPIKDFVINTPEGVDTTQAILNDPREMMVLFVKEMNEYNDWLVDFKAVATEMQQQGRPIIVITSDFERVKKVLGDYKIEILVLKGDAVAIKTAARSTPTLYRIQQGVILNKWGRLDLKDAIIN